MKRPARWLGAGALLALALLALLLMAERWQERPQAPPQPLRIAINSAYAGSCPVLAAHASGAFARQGIAAALLGRASGKAALEAVLEGQAELATVADLPIMFAGLKRQPVQVIATIFRADYDHGIVGRRDRGVLDAASLKGKRIGVSFHTSAHFVLHAMLNREGLGPQDVTMVNYPQEQLSAALSSGAVDAVSSWEPQLGAILTALGGNGVAFYGQDNYESLYNLAGLQSYLASHPAIVARVLRALAEGARYCREQPRAARALLNNKPGEAARLDAAWPGFRFGVTLDQGLLLALEDEARWALGNELGEKAAMPNYLDHIYLDGLQAVAPAAITLIH